MQASKPDTEGQVIWRKRKHKAIFLDSLELPSHERFRFCKAIVAGRKAGIEVVTAATPASEQAISSLPRGVTEKDLESSPWRWEGRVQSLQISPTTGMGLAGCGSCGKCHSCLRLYPEELWKLRDTGTYFKEENLAKWKKEDAARIAEEIKHMKSGNKIWGYL
ncbi:uncharacterized protein B0I36DRAFT_316525 [Microdochium trichocladiopsis]|uniref:Uncharacterized protein n=1 Tax=Microdochium trichocladiopsis TaxID=1682393 RepID=A0A9P9BSG7_9PEZI|nr:uncharacterized protein B0I36DRAFT_316525 [Microdochium trichocladiopsis]KAH7034559.1 hypothetical protein B0I36DRAFT_316525 [Microdochium trichocladiopsis]